MSLGYDLSILSLSSNEIWRIWRMNLYEGFEGWICIFIRNTLIKYSFDFLVFDKNIKNMSSISSNTDYKAIIGVVLGVGAIVGGLVCVTGYLSKC